MQSASYSDVVGSKYAQLCMRAAITRRCKAHLNLRLHQGYISRFQPHKALSTDTALLDFAALSSRSHPVPPRFPAVSLLFQDCPPPSAALRSTSLPRPPSAQPHSLPSFRRIRPSPPPPSSLRALPSIPSTTPRRIPSVIDTDRPRYHPAHTLCVVSRPVVRC